MMKRCRQQRHTKYPAYGARGVRVCGEWADFGRFLADMGERPSRQHTLDRIDPCGDYEPSNCRWATPHQQRVNTRKARARGYPGFVDHTKGRLVISKSGRRWRFSLRDVSEEDLPAFARRCYEEATGEMW